MNYQRMYGVGLVDDLHNYFPDILYRPERFGTVGALLSYIQNQVRDEFNIFRRGAAAHGFQAAYPPQVVFTTPLRHPRRAPHPAMAHPPVSPPPLQRVAVTSHVREQAISDAHFLNLLGTVTGILRGDVVVDESVNMEPVVVRPTAEQVSSATTIEVVDAEDDVCAICQDAMPPGTNARNLNACDHRFHTGCIDTWFMTNVHCPVCRHDIREG